MRKLFTRGCLGLLAGLGLASQALASPLINSAVVLERVFNDIPSSTLTSSDLYPGSITISDQHVSAPSGWANRHGFSLSENDTTAAVFYNNDAFAFSADVTLSCSTGSAEGGLRLSPWWSHDVDGQYMLNAASGEVAIFGGRLPFYSFTANHGISYAQGTTVRLGMIYSPNGLSEMDPATIIYTYQDGSGSYSSGPLAFNQTNPNDPPEYGDWGMLNDARVGGYFQVVNNPDNPDHGATIVWGNMVYVPEPASLALLGLSGLALLRRR